jgi:disulfide bond formation protein DsbB
VMVMVMVMVMVVAVILIMILMRNVMRLVHIAPIIYQCVGSIESAALELKRLRDLRVRMSGSLKKLARIVAHRSQLVVMPICDLLNRVISVV